MGARAMLRPRLRAMRSMLSGSCLPVLFWGWVGKRALVRV